MIIGLGIIAIPVVYLGFFMGVNQLTAGDVSQYVSNQSCESPDVEGSCPEGLDCYGNFEAERIGVELGADEGRCALPEYREYYCGIFEYTLRKSNFLVCSPVLHLPHQQFSLLQENWQDLDRIYTSEPDGEEQLAAYNLTLANHDPGT